MKSVMISIKPKWCELIASGRKTIEVRKSSPKLEAPFKCYIYCTQARIPIRDSGRILMYEDDLALTNRWDQGKLVENPCGTMMEGEFSLNGKVIGEFVCDEVLQFYHDDYNSSAYDISDDDLNRTCLLQEDLYRYASGKTLYGWHISGLVIYDKPMELGDFWKTGKCPYVTENGCTYRGHCSRAGQTNRCGEPLARPPQSWCYVEEVRK